MPPDIAALIAEARTALDQVLTAVPAALAADRRTHYRFHSGELERVRADHDRRLAELKQDLLEARNLAEACIADADESAETASALQVRNDMLSRELEATVAERDKLCEINVNLQRMCDEERSMAHEAHTAAAAGGQQVRGLLEQVEALARERSTLADALEKTREAKALAEGRCEQLRSVVQVDRERLARFDALLGESMMNALRLTQHEKEQDRGPPA